MILCYFFQFFCLVLGAVVMVGVTNFWLFLLLVPLTFVFIYARFYYMQTARDIKRIELAGRQAFYLVLLQNFDGTVGTPYNTNVGVAGGRAAGERHVLV